MSGIGEAEEIFQMYRFFHNPQIAQFMKLQAVETVYQSLGRLGFEEGSYPTLQEVKAQGLRALDGNANQLLSSTAIEPAYMKFLKEERDQIRDAILYLETNYGELASMRYASHPNQALATLGITLSEVADRKLMEALYMTVMTDADRLAAYHYLHHLYTMTPEQVRGLQQQLVHGVELQLQLEATREALQIIEHFPRNAEWYIPQMMGR